MSGNLRRDGLGREVALSLVHADGHVGALANQGITEAVVTRLHLLYSYLGSGGWSLAYLPVEDAVNAHLRGQNCRVCVLVFGCGCTIGRVMQGQCTHGTPLRMHMLSHVIGHCDNDSPNHVGPALPTLLRVYEPGCRYAHLAASVAGEPAACGETEPAGGWRGWATERQQAVAVRQPLCKACITALGGISAVAPGTPLDGALS